MRQSCSAWAELLAQRTMRNRMEVVVLCSELQSGLLSALDNWINNPVIAIRVCSAACNRKSSAVFYTNKWVFSSARAHTHSLTHRKAATQRLYEIKLSIFTILLAFPSRWQDSCCSTRYHVLIPRRKMAEGKGSTSHLSPSLSREPKPSQSQQASMSVSLDLLRSSALSQLQKGQEEWLTRSPWVA